MINAYSSRLEHALVLAMAFTNFDPTEGALRRFAESLWDDKFAAAFDLATDTSAKRARDILGRVKKDHRNPISHGGFDKKGTVFHFHVPGIAPVPAILVLYPALEQLLDSSKSLPSLDRIADYLREYAERVLDNRAVAFRLEISTETGLQAFLDEQLRNILGDVFGRWQEGEGSDANAQTGGPGLRDGEKVGNEQDKPCWYHGMISDALADHLRYKEAKFKRSAAFVESAISQLAGLSARRYLAGTVKSYLQARVDYWMAVYSRRVSDERIIDSTPVPAENPAPRKTKMGRKQHPVNKMIDDMLREIAKARPRSQREVIYALEDRRAPLPRQQFFQRAGRYKKAWKMSPERSRQWVSQKLRKLGVKTYFAGARGGELQ